MESESKAKRGELADSAELTGRAGWGIEKGGIDVVLEGRASWVLKGSSTLFTEIYFTPSNPTSISTTDAVGPHVSIEMNLLLKQKCYRDEVWITLKPTHPAKSLRPDAAAAYVLNPTSPKLAEASVARHNMQLSETMSYRKVTLELDCAMVVTAVSDKERRQQGSALS
ncbi:unnamed protein product [Dovyalis caffra]|uniref:Uncharacterized protein n=1 Tax=Dovyalis caffra TaxID=77055 RepID=A0AAV1S8G5_9ROSI|nr:unnamed protein product [Dovyalis caffra]